MATETMRSTETNNLARIVSTLHPDCAQTIEHVLATFDVLDELVVLTDTQGAIVYANPATVRMTGYEQGDLMGRTPALWRLTGDEAGEWNTVVEQKHVYHGIKRNKRKDGTLYEADVQVMPVPGGDGVARYCVYVERDITQVARVERTERRFMALASHNLKTPLAAVRWQAEMLRDGDAGRLSSSQLEYVEEILSGITRTVAMVEQWFDVTRMDLGLYTFRTEPTDIGEVIQAVLVDMHARIEQEGVSVQYLPEPSQKSVLMDRDVLQVIVHTLVHNAVKFNREGGTVHIQTTLLPPQVEYAGKTFSETRVVISVRDSGVGIPVDEQRNVFRQFFHASNIGTARAEGAGLGLYLAYAFIQKVGGDIWFTSTEQGSHFVVALPTGDAPPDTTSPNTPLPLSNES